jgi:hypothetical protein
VQAGRLGQPLIAEAARDVRHCSAHLLEVDRSMDVVGDTEATAGRGGDVGVIDAARGTSGGKQRHTLRVMLLRPWVSACAAQPLLQLRRTEVARLASKRVERLKQTIDALVRLATDQKPRHQVVQRDESKVVLRNARSPEPWLQQQTTRADGGTQVFAGCGKVARGCL